ncbi:hypothetical protein KL906_003866 [Ogataea polymorpha]|uniref:Uracil-DNA glycosylase-like domain-containing protein n=1 Tax=Ogataea polymorpha TaxID=460523 RepID=A0A9P8NUT6_9ASCO|nr:hypothetical protein KL906_003866 [Ogataea polymorpha]KAG7915717.1 hypothetical protein KL927_003993 [Ogataea polymorpha]KAH3659935.1 hypothetical protein OGATHE_005980 [Ogataea polymorpha]
MLKKYGYEEKQQKRVIRSKRPSPVSPKLPDLNPSLRPGLAVVFIGYNPSIRSSSLQHHYAHPTNLFWKLFNESGILSIVTNGAHSHPCAAKDDWDLLQYGIGFTDLVLRPTQNAGQLTKTEMAHNVPRLCAELRSNQPAVACFVGKGIWEQVCKTLGYKDALKSFSWGRQPLDLEGCTIFVIPSTSGLVTISYKEKLTRWLELGAYVSNLGVDKTAKTFGVWGKTRGAQSTCEEYKKKPLFLDAGDAGMVRHVSGKDIDHLVDVLVRLHDQKSSGQRVIVAVCGAPGSGKSLITNKVVNRLNERFGKQIGVVVPQDGFHYYMKELLQMDDPDTMVARRGADFTFNAEGLVDLVRQIRERPEEEIYAPSFDHKIKDPVEESIVIRSENEIVIIEGNYVCLDKEPWSKIRQLADASWMVVARPELIRERIVRRHLEAGISKTREEAEKRADENDMVNGKYVIEHSRGIDLAIDNE